MTYGTGDNLRVLTLDAGPSGMSLNRVASEFKNIPENDAGNGDNYVDATVTQGEDGQYYLEFTPSNGGTGSENRIMVTQPPDATAFESSASNATFSYSVGSGSPVSIDVPTDTTLSGLAELINSTPNNGGVTASIINTGSGDSPYKLVLKANDTGEASRITIHSQLDGLPMTQENGDGYIMAADNALDFTNPITIRMVDNNTNFVFSEDTGNGFQAPITAKIADGVYQNGEDLAAAVETALEQASAQSGAGADYSVQYNTGTQKLEISQHGTLDGVAINWSDPTSTAANALGFTNDATITPKTSSLNSAFALDGIDYQREDNTGLTDVIDGVNFTLAGIGTSNISITENTSGIITEIKEMINTLNELAKEIDANDDYNKETGEWGTLAKTPSIGNAKERLLSLVGSQLHVDGSSITSFYDMGLEVSRDGSITLDESILTQKVNGSFTDVEKFFLGNDSITGMADQINDMLKEFTKAQGLMQSETQAVDTKITQMTEDITSKTEQIEKKYETMAAQFTELDKYMRQMQSQQNFITQMTEAQKNSNK
ncbi:MAG: flagellar filament capping protein FliD [Desulfobacterales bacterium]|nr:flagellar filament capping protein FliD [Desulfobacterales bacterium]